MKFEDLQKQVLEWGDEKGITHSENIDKQFMKFIEEVFEFKTELDTHLLVNNFTKAIPDENLKLEMGDILVTLIILSKQLDIDIISCSFNGMIFAFKCPLGFTLSHTQSYL